MKPLQLPKLTQEALRDLDRLYRTTRDVRLRTRAQIILLAAEKELLAADIAEIVRTDEQTVRRWLKRYQDQGLAGLADEPRSGGPRKVTDTYLATLVQASEKLPGTLGLPHPRWTTARLAEYMVQQTGIQVDPETIRLHLKSAGIHLSRTSGKPASQRKNR